MQEVSEITQGLKALAKELDVPVLALAQLSRQVEQRDDKRPQLSDLRESGSIEQDADIVMFVYREPYYLAREKPQEGTEEFFAWQERMSAVDGTAEVIIGKNRHGPTGAAKMAFEDRFTRFTDLQEDDHCRSAWTDMAASDQAELTIDLAALAANYKTMQKNAGQAATSAVVKADGYGLGMAQIAPALFDAGCTHILGRAIK